MTSRGEGDSGRNRRGTVRSALARRRDARAPRVLVKSLDASEPGAKTALEAAEALISAAQRGSDA